MTAAHLDGVDTTHGRRGREKERTLLQSTPVDRPVHVAVAMFTVCHSVSGSRPSHMLPNRPCIGIEIITAYFFSLPGEPTRAHMVSDGESEAHDPQVCWEHRKSGIKTIKMRRKQSEGGQKCRHRCQARKQMQGNAGGA